MFSSCIINTIIFNHFVTKLKTIDRHLGNKPMLMFFKRYNKLKTIIISFTVEHLLFR